MFALHTAPIHTKESNAAKSAHWSPPHTGKAKQSTRGNLALTGSVLNDGNKLVQVEGWLVLDVFMQGKPAVSN